MPAHIDQPILSFLSAAQEVHCTFVCLFRRPFDRGQRRRTAGLCFPRTLLFLVTLPPRDPDTNARWIPSPQSPMRTIQLDDSTIGSLAGTIQSRMYVLSEVLRLAFYPTLP